MKDRLYLLFSKIENREEAISLAKMCGIAFMAVAALQAAVFAFSATADILVYAACGLLIHNIYSRVAAVVVFTFSIAALFITFSNAANQDYYSGTNTIFALIAALTGARALEATFKLAGRFSETPKISGST